MTYPKVGIGVMILNGREVLLGKRKGSHGEGEYAFPGGHLEYLEEFEECVLREIKEECGVSICNLEFQCLANILIYKPKHYVHIGFLAEYLGGEPKVLEPDKVESWGWYNLDNLPRPIFLPSALGLEAYTTGKTHFGRHDVGWQSIV